MSTETRSSSVALDLGDVETVYHRLDRVSICSSVCPEHSEGLPMKPTCVASSRRVFVIALIGHLPQAKPGWGADFAHSRQAHTDGVLCRSDLTSLRSMV